jgi:hypothetical protein
MLLSDYLATLSGMDRICVKSALNTLIRHKGIVLKRHEIVEQAVCLPNHGCVQFTQLGAVRYTIPSPPDGQYWLECTKLEFDYYLHLGGVIRVAAVPELIDLSEKERRIDGRINRLMGETKSFKFGEYEYVAFSARGAAWKLVQTKPFYSEAKRV